MEKFHKESEKLKDIEDLATKIMNSLQGNKDATLVVGALTQVIGSYLPFVPSSYTGAALADTVALIITNYHMSMESLGDLVNMAKNNPEKLKQVVDETILDHPRFEKDREALIGAFTDLAGPAQSLEDEVSLVQPVKTEKKSN